MSSNQAGIVSGSVGFASRALVQLLMFGVTIVATRVLTIDAFGAYALASLFLILARALFYVGPYEYLLKSKPDPQLYSACFSANLALAGLSGCVLAGCYFMAPLVFETDVVGLLIALLAPSILLVATTAWYEAMLLRSGRVRQYYLGTLIGDICGATVAVGLLLNDFGVKSLVVQTYARLFVLLLFYVLGAKDHPGFGHGIKRIAEILSWSRARYAAVLLNFTSAYGADILLGALLSPAATGLYRASSRIVSSLTDLFAQPLQKIAQTNLSARFVREQDLGNSWLTMLSGVGAIAWSALLTLAYLASDLVPFALGEKWSPAVPVVIAFCVIKSFSMLDAVTTSFLVCHDRQHAMLGVQIGAAAAVIALALAFAPWGATAVAIAVGAATTAMSIIYGVMAMRISQQGAEALISLARTSAPPVLCVAFGLALMDWFTPGLKGETAILAGMMAALFGFAIGSYAVRYRMLSAIGSLGHAAPGALPGGPA